MASSETVIANLALQRMGQSQISSIGGTSALEVKVNLIYNQVRDELLTAGPLLGWKFARRTYHGIDDDSATITAFALASATTTTVTATHGLLAGDMVEIEGTTSYDGTYDVVSVSTTVSFVITKVFVADDATGTAGWRSEEYAYRYAIPTSMRVVKVSVGGIELTDWIRDGVYILTNLEDEEVDMTIVRAITDVTLFPFHFTRVLVLLLAIQLHYNLTQDLKAIQLLAEEASNAMPKAIAMDEREKYVKESSNSWAEVGNTQENIE